ncbi:MAG: Mur ligase family protein [bacterium]
MGVVLEVAFDDANAESLLASWKEYATLLVGRHERSEGPDRSELVVRRHPGGASLFLSAPVDALMSSTDVNEHAWALAESGSRAQPAPTLVAELRAKMSSERASRPNLADVYREALQRELNVTFDDELLTLGSGSGSSSWPLADIPHVAQIDWSALHDVPIALVTGSNGKTTTTRLVAAMCRGAGKTTGWSCSDGVWIDDDQLEHGDYSGPGGARVVLRDARVDAAVLETARGGILRRGLAVSRARAAIITNIAADHFGEYGVSSLHDLAEAKAVVARALGDSGCLVLNADDPMLVELAEKLESRRAWFSVAPDHPALDTHVTNGGDAATVHDGRVMLHVDDAWHDLGAVDAMPLTFGGAAPHNIQNILGAALLASVLHVPTQTIRATLGRFGASPADNPGRLQIYRFGALTVLVDYAHNPDGLEALCETAKKIPAKRRLLLLGQAGNRDDDQLRALARVACNVIAFDRVIIKEMPSMLRGRSEGEISRVLAEELTMHDVPMERIDIAPNELDAIRRAFTWARESDLLVCPVHVEKEAMLSMLARMTERGWTAGATLPE